MSSVMKKHIIHINSKHNESSNPSNAVYSFRLPDLQESIGVRLKDVAVTNLIYNVNTGKNDVLDYNYNGVDKSITIPEGNYNATTLAQSLNLLQADVVFSINAVTQKFVITGTLVSYVRDSSTIKKVLGFSTTTLPLLQYELEKPFNFIRTHFINVLSNLADTSACYTSNKRQYNLIAQIPLNLPFGFILNQEQEKDTSDNHYFLQNVNISHLQIKIVDDDFEEIDLNQGDYVLTFVIFKR